MSTPHDSSNAAAYRLIRSVAGRPEIERTSKAEEGCTSIARYVNASRSRDSETDADSGTAFGFFCQSFIMTLSMEVQHMHWSEIEAICEAAQALHPSEDVPQRSRVIQCLLELCTSRLGYWRNLLRAWDHLTECFPVEVLEEHGDPQVIQEVRHVGRLLVSAQKELLAQISAFMSNWGDSLSSAAPVDDSEHQSFLNHMQHFIQIYSETKVLWDGAHSVSSIEIQPTLPKFRSVIWTIRSVNRLQWSYSQSSNNPNGIKKLNVEQTPMCEPLEILVGQFCSARALSIRQTVDKASDLASTCLHEEDELKRILTDSGNHSRGAVSGDWSTLGSPQEPHDAARDRSEEALAQFLYYWIVQDIYQAPSWAEMGLEVVLWRQDCRSGPRAVAGAERHSVDALTGERPDSTEPLKALLSPRQVVNWTVPEIGHRVVRMNRLRGIWGRNRKKQAKRKSELAKRDLLRLSTNPLAGLPVSKRRCNDALLVPVLMKRHESGANRAFSVVLQISREATRDLESGSSKMNSLSSATVGGICEELCIVLEALVGRVLTALRTQMSSERQIEAVAEFFIQLRLLTEEGHLGAQIEAGDAVTAVRTRSMSCCLDVLQALLNQLMRYGLFSRRELTPRQTPPIQSFEVVRNNLEPLLGVWMGGIRNALGNEVETPNQRSDEEPSSTLTWSENVCENPIFARRSLSVRSSENLSNQRSLKSEDTSDSAGLGPQTLLTVQSTNLAPHARRPSDAQIGQLRVEPTTLEQKLLAEIKRLLAATEGSCGNR